MRFAKARFWETGRPTVRPDRAQRFAAAAGKRRAGWFTASATAPAATASAAGARGTRSPGGGVEIGPSVTSRAARHRAAMTFAA